MTHRWKFLKILVYNEGMAKLTQKWHMFFNTFASSICILLIVRKSHEIKIITEIFFCHVYDLFYICIIRYYDEYLYELRCIFYSFWNIS